MTIDQGSALTGLPSGEATSPGANDITYMVVDPSGSKLSQYVKVSSLLSKSGLTLMSANSSAGATSLSVYGLPLGVPSAGGYVVIDPYTTECEVRRITSRSGTTINLESTLSYTHSQDNAILFVDNAELNVLWFGAAVDGTTDDSLAIQRAIDQAPHVDGDRGATIHFPHGTYYLATGLTTIYHNLKLVGEGGHGYGNIPVGSTILATDQAIVMLTLGNGTQTVWGGPTLQGICFQDSSGTALGAIKLQGVANWTFRDINFENFLVGYCVYLEGTLGAICQYGHMENMWMRNCKYGVRGAGDNTDVFFLGGYFQGSPGGVIADSRAISQADTGTGRWIVHATRFNNWAKAIEITGGHFWAITDCVFEQTGTNVDTGTGIEISVSVGAGYYDGQGNKVQGCLFTNWNIGVVVGANARDTILFGDFFATCVTAYQNSGSNTTVVGSGSGSNVAVANRIPQLAIAPSTEKTIATGVITITQSYHSVDTEADAATDDLDTVNGGESGQILILRADNAARTVVVKDGTGNMLLAGDMTLNNSDDTITMIYNGANWLELARSDNAA